MPKPVSFSEIEAELAYARQQKRAQMVRVLELRVSPLTSILLVISVWASARAQAPAPGDLIWLVILRCL